MKTRRDFLRNAVIAGAGVAAGTIVPQASAASSSHIQWDKEADIVVVGAGATGLPAAIQARDDGASVILLEATKDIGGHAIVSGGNVPLGGGTSIQKKYNIADTPDLLFSDLTDWSVVEPNGFPDYRYNDREIIRAFADNSAGTFEWLVAHGVIFVNKGPDNFGGTSVGNSVFREMHSAPMGWDRPETGKPFPRGAQAIASHGVGLMRPLEVTARKSGVQIFLEHRMTGLIRESPNSGKVIGVKVETKGIKLNIRAKKAVILGTGGFTGNVNFRRIFDPRLTEEYCGVAGEPWSFQDASGELAAMAVGASLWGAFNQTGEFGSNITKPGQIGCQYGYNHLRWMPGSPVFQSARASGLGVGDWQNLILVNQAGQRFYDETAGQFTANNSHAVSPYTQGSYRNPTNVKYDPNSVNFINAALAGTGLPVNGGGPIWAIFDADAVKRESWDPKPPNVDFDGGYFFTANTIAELAGKMVMKYQPKGLPAAVLQDAVARYNAFVDAGKDADFGKPAPKYKIQTAPFYAAWATPVVHDSRAGLRINGQCQVIDLEGKVIPGLYCGGESAGGFSQHGLARCTVQGRIAAMHAVGKTKA
ncbi:MAG: FAD-dependent oxidoreductase [Candidatus Korobacteraceae bacterium]|jgi:succinate dehydrogenase/fumarate reductase flavoprotein subunit